MQIQGCIGREGGGSGKQKFVNQKWPDQIFRMINFVFSHNGHFGPERGRGGGPPTVVSRYIRVQIQGATAEGACEESTRGLRYAP